MCKRGSLLAIVYLVACTCCFAHGTYKEPVFPVVGKPCGFFELKDIRFYKKKNCELTDFRGKWLILDFWGINCVSCIASFPRIDKEQRAFKDSVQFMMVAFNDRESRNQSFYRRIRERENLSMPCAFDSALYRSWIKTTVGLIVVVDPGGIVRAVTTSLDTVQLDSLFADRNYSNFLQYNSSWFDSSKSTGGVERDAGNDILVSSSVSRFNSFTTKHLLPFLISDSSGIPIDIDIRGISLTGLFCYAYLGYRSPDDVDSAYGKTYYKCIIHVKDSTLFDSSYGRSLNLFSYRLIASSKALDGFTSGRDVMKKELRLYFGFVGEFEFLDEPCIYIYADDKSKARLSTRGGRGYAVGDLLTGFSGVNMPMKDLIYGFRAVVGRQVVIDSTGISGNVDIKLSGISDLQSLKREARKVGLRVVEASRRMRVLVIKDE